MRAIRTYAIKIRYIEKNENGKLYDAADYLTIQGNDIIDAIKNAKQLPQYNKVLTRTPDVFEAYEVTEEFK